MIGVIASLNSKSGGTPPVSPTVAPFIINALPRSATEIFIYFNTAGADSYVLERATDVGFTLNLTDLDSEGYDGTSLTYNDTGLSANTVYYYRVKSILSGFEDSEYTTTSCSTHYVDPVGWYSVEGGERLVDNDYLDWTTNQVVAFRNHSATGAGPDFDASTGNITYNVQTSKRGAVLASVGSSAYTAASDLTLSGNFCVPMYIEHSNDAATCAIMSQTSNNAYIWLNTTKTALQIRIGGSNYNVALTGTLPSNTLSKVVLKRVADKASASIDGGYNYGAETTVSTADVSFNRFFATDANGSRNMTSWLMFAFFDDVLTGDQLAPFFEPYKQADYTLTDPVTVNPLFTGDWRSLTNGSPLDAGISVADNGSFAWRRVFSKGDYFFVKSTKDATAFNSEQLLITGDHNTMMVSPAITLPAYIADANIHNQSSIVDFDNTVVQIGPNEWYDNNDNTLEIREFGHEYDLRYYTQKQIGGGVTNQYASSNGYFQATTLGNTLAVLTQKFTNYADGVKIFYSTDRMNLWNVVQPLTSTSPAWCYPYLLNAGPSSTWFYFIICELTSGTNKYPSISLLKTQNFSTFYNIEESYSYTVNPNSLVNLTTIKTNAAMRETSGDTEKNVPPGNFMIDENGLVYGIHGDGENTGWEVTYYNSGWQHVDVDFPAAQNVVLPPSGPGTNFNRVSPNIFNIGANTYEVYALCDPASNGLYRVGKFTTSDNFATEVTFVGYVSTDNTRKHWNLQPDFNYHFNDHAVLVGTQVDGSDGYEWIYQLK